jgi:hypothetical protein
MAGITVGRMDSQLSGGQRENQPAAARVNGRQAKHVPEERTHLLSLGREDDGVHASDHGEILITAPSAGK